MMRLGLLAASVLLGCSGPALVPVSDVDGGVDAGALAPERLVKVLYAYQVEVGEDAAWSAFVDDQAASEDQQGFQFQFSVFAFGLEGGALVVPFGSRAALRDAMRRQQPLRVIDAPGKPGERGPQQIGFALGSVADLVWNDAKALTTADRERVEYRVLFVTTGGAFGASCPLDACPVHVCCTSEVIRATQRMRAFLELWDAERVSVQPMRVTDGAVDPVDTYLLDAVAREGGTRLVTTTRAALPASLSAIDLRRAR